MNALAAPAADVPAVGPHERLFLFKKNENPQNVMAVYTKLDADCRFETANRRPVFDFYWLMNGTTYKRVHPLIKSGIRDRLEFDLTRDRGAPAGASFSVRINDLKTVKNDLEDPRLTVHAEKRGGRCETEATMTLGPSDGRVTLRLQSLDTVAVKTLWPPFRRLVSVTVNGVDPKTGREIHRRYSAE